MDCRLGKIKSVKSVSEHSVPVIAVQTAGLPVCVAAAEAGRLPAPLQQCTSTNAAPFPTHAWRRRFSRRPAANSAAMVPVTRPYGFQHSSVNGITPATAPRALAALLAVGLGIPSEINVPALLGVCSPFLSDCAARATGCGMRHIHRSVYTFPPGGVWRKFGCTDTNGIIPLSCWCCRVAPVEKVISFTNLARLLQLGPIEGPAGPRIAVDHTQRLTDVHKCTNARLLGVNDSWVVASIRISADNVPPDALPAPTVLFLLQPL
eukprot:363913-Chlamydomonas_euryale.AAC.12